MSVDYNDFAKTFSNSRKNLKWEEIDYFLSNPHLTSPKGEEISILDIWCGNWRFLWILKKSPLIRGDLEGFNYLWVDLSKWLLTEAKKLHPENEFLELNMLDISKIKQKFNHIFFIASFHHLNTIKDRKKVLSKAYDLLEDWGKIYMTNWALNSELNKEKYSDSIMNSSENEFWSLDYIVKIGQHNRYYHCFDLSELEYLFIETWFEIIENREFENKRNFVSIIQKKWD